MELAGVCDFCGDDFEGEGLAFRSQNRAKKRPTYWAAKFPGNKPALPDGVTFDPRSLEQAGIEVKMACPACWRE